MRQARIVQKTKNPMQSGKANTDEWVIEFVPMDPQRPDPLMGWAGSRDTTRQLSLQFATLDSARAYAERNAITYVVVPAPPKALKLQSYADNFR
jgi:hypothetical protein